MLLSYYYLSSVRCDLHAYMLPLENGVGNCCPASSVGLDVMGMGGTMLGDVAHAWAGFQAGACCPSVWCSFHH